MEKKAVELFPFWDKLTEAEKKYVENGSIAKCYDKGAYVHSGAEDCIGPSVIISGEVRVCLLSEEGREITLYRLHAGDCCVLSASCIIDKITFDTHLIAQTDCKLLTILPTVFKRLIETNVNIKCAIYELATERFSAAVWTMQNIFFKGFERRLAEFLVSEYERNNSLTINLTHEAIANYISSAREVVARTIKQFANEGWVAQKRGAILITDLSALRDLL